MYKKINISTPFFKQNLSFLNGITALFAEEQHEHVDKIEDTGC